MGCTIKCLPKLVTGESISQTSQFIATQNADIGFTAKSIVISKEMQGKGKWVELNTQHYPPIEQSAVLLKHAKQSNEAAARKFYNFLYYSKGKSYLQQIRVYCKMIELAPLWLTLKLALSTTLILFIIAVPLANWLTGDKGVFKVVVQTIVSMPLVLPPTVIGFYLLLAFSPAICFWPLAGRMV